MAKSVFTPEENAELELLQAEYQAATTRAVRAIRAHGMDSQAFLQADAEAGIAAKRIKEILGIAGQDWMAT